MPRDRLGYGQRFATSLYVVTQEADIYACPLCLTRVDLTKIESLTWDHYPPQSIGGRDRDTVLICEECRKRWDRIDAQVNVVKKHHEFHRQFPDATPARIRYSDVSGRPGPKIRVALSPHEEGIRTVARPGSNSPQLINHINQIEQELKASGRLINQPVVLETDQDLSFDQRVVERAFLKAAYLAAFNCLGYPYILSPALALVRQQMLDPTVEVFPYRTAFSPFNEAADREVVTAYIQNPPQLAGFGIIFEGYNLSNDFMVILPGREALLLPDYSYLDQKMHPNLSIEFHAFHCSESLIIESGIMIQGDSEAWHI